MLRTLSGGDSRVRLRGRLQSVSTDLFREHRKPDFSGASSEAVGCEKVDDDRSEKIGLFKVQEMSCTGKGVDRRDVHRSFFDYSAIGKAEIIQ